MATLPTDGGDYNAWGSELNTFLQVGHDSDGTHKKSQVLTDMGWSPTSYAGEESITFPNGLIWKQGTTNRSGDNTTITFAVAFPTACVRVFCGNRDSSSTTVTATAVETVTAAGFVANNQESNLDGYDWMAIGY